MVFWLSIVIMSLCTATFSVLNDKKLDSRKKRRSVIFIWSLSALIVVVFLVIENSHRFAGFLH